MASINEKELARIIKSGEASGVYYLYGTDLYSVTQYKKALVESVIKKGDEVYNLHEFQGRDLDVEGMSDACEAYPLFAEKLCVTVCDLDLEEETKQRQNHDTINDSRLKLLIDTASNVPDTTVLIFYTANIDICGGKKYPTSKNKKLLDAVAKHGTVCEVNIKTMAEMAKTISGIVAKEGGSIDQRAAAMIIERCCGDINLAVNEAKKLCSYAVNRQITTEDVSLLTHESSDAESYNLTDAVAAGNTSLAMKLYNELLDDPKNTPIYLLYALTGSMNDLYRARLALDHNHSVADVIKDFGYSRNIEFRVKKAFSAVRKIPLEQLRRCMNILAQADMDMKSGGGTPALILEKAMLQMLSR